MPFIDHRPRAATLTDFLLARITEDETAARAALGGEFTMTNRDAIVGPKQVAAADGWVAHIARHAPARALAECEAKRRIAEGWREALDRHIHTEQPIDGEDFYGGGEWGIEFAVRALAAVYADHPDYRDEWRP